MFDLSIKNLNTLLPLPPPKKTPTKPKTTHTKRAKTNKNTNTKRNTKKFKQEKKQKPESFWIPSVADFVYVLTNAFLLYSPICSGRSEIWATNSSHLFGAAAWETSTSSTQWFTSVNSMSCSCKGWSRAIESSRPVLFCSSLVSCQLAAQRLLESHSMQRSYKPWYISSVCWW